MQRKKFKKLIDLLSIHKSKLLALLTSFILVTEVGFKLPYLNLFTFDFSWRLFILYILFILWFRPSYNFLILASILFLLLGQFGEVMGILIYISLLTALIKYLIYRKRAQNV